ncbi:MAG: ABC transporter substrate-binding protein, partial [Treponemataceae bacterium]
RNKYNLYLVSGEPIDIIWTATWFGYAQRAASGAFLPIDHLVDAYAPKLKQAIPEMDWKVSKVGNKSYCVPDMNQTNSSWGVVWREDLRKKYKCPEIKDLASLEAYYDAIIKNEPDMIPTVDASYGGLWHTYTYMFGIYSGLGAGEFRYGFAADMRNPRNLFVHTETDYFKKYAQIARRWVEKKYFEADYASRNVNTGDGVLSGRYASAVRQITPQSANSTIIVPGKKLHPDWDFGFMTWAEMFKIAYANCPSFLSVALSKACPNPERAMMFLELLLTDKDLSRLVAYGIEGTHYKIDEKGKYVSLNDPKNPGFLSNALGLNTLMNPALAVYPESYDFELKQENIQKALAVPNYYQGFPEDPSSYSAESAAIMQTWEQYGVPLMNGYVPNVEEGIATLNKKMAAAGREIVFAAYKKQWDAWLDSLGIKK